MNRLALKRISIILLAIFFVAAGILHFVKTSVYLHIMPPWIPHAIALVYVSGILEVLGGIGVTLPTVRRLSGYGLIALLIAVFPANVHMALNTGEFPSIPAALLWLRLPLQLVLIGWVWWSTHDVDDKPRSSQT